MPRRLYPLFLFARLGGMFARRLGVKGFGRIQLWVARDVGPDRRIFFVVAMGGLDSRLDFLRLCGCHDGHRAGFRHSAVAVSPGDCCREA